jgi:hypothetical protein
MKNKPDAVKAFLLLFCLFLLIPALHGKTYRVYYLGGQSNMDGYGWVKELPEELTEPVEGVMIFHGNTSPDGTETDGKGLWSVLQPGHGVGFSSDSEKNEYSERFGVEITYARRIRELRPGQDIALIKYSRGGTSIHEDAAGRFGCWEPDFLGGEGKGRGINQYDHFLATIRNAFSVKDIDGDGTEDRLIPAGIVWMQGESDAAHTLEVAESYQANLKRLMDLIRAALRTDDLPVVIGRISDSRQDPSGKVWEYGDVLRASQAAYAESDEGAALVTSTDGYGYSDKWHYDTAGYLDLGKRFAEAMSEMLD